MFTKVLIISVSLEEQKMIEAVMAQYDPGSMDLKTSVTFSQPADWWKVHKPDLLLIRYPTDPIIEPQFAKKIKTDVPLDVPILFLTTQMSNITDLS